MSDETTPATPSDPTLPAPDAAPAGAPPTSDAPDQPPPAVTDEQRLADRLAGPGASPTMPWGTGPRPEGWVDSVRPTGDAPVFHMLHWPGGPDFVEMDGKGWLELTEDQAKQIRALSGTGPSLAAALDAAGVKL